MHSSKEFKIVAFGDSTTALRDGLIVYADKVEAALKSQGLNVEVFNAGIGGNDTVMAAERFERDVLSHSPDLTIIQFGINDCSIDVWRDPPETEPRISLDEYRTNLEGFVDALQAAGAAVILMTPNQQRWSAILKEYYGKPPFDLNDRKSMTHLVAEYAGIVREVAREKEVPLVDIYQAYDDYEEQHGVDCAGLLLDGSHPNQDGQDLVASRLLELLPGILKSRESAV